MSASSGGVLQNSIFHIWPIYFLLFSFISTICRQTTANSSSDIWTFFFVIFFFFPKQMAYFVFIKEFHPNVGWANVQVSGIAIETVFTKLKNHVNDIDHKCSQRLIRSGAMNTHLDWLNRSQLYAYVRDRKSNVVCHTEGTEISPLNSQLQLQFQIQATGERKVMLTSFRLRNSVSFALLILFVYDKIEWFYYVSRVEAATIIQSHCTNEVMSTRPD